MSKPSYFFVLAAASVAALSLGFCLKVRDKPKNFVVLHGASHLRTALPLENVPVAFELVKKITDPGFYGTVGKSFVFKGPKGGYYTVTLQQAPDDQPTCQRAHVEGLTPVSATGGHTGLSAMVYIGCRGAGDPQ